MASQALKFKVARAAAKATREANEKAAAKALEKKAQAAQQQVDNSAPGSSTRLGDAAEATSGSPAKAKAEARLAKAEKAYTAAEGQQSNVAQPAAKEEGHSVTQTSTRKAVQPTSTASTQPQHAQDVAQAPSLATEKQWQKLAAEADDIAKEKMFYSHLLKKVSKAETAYSGLLKQEKTSDRTAKRVESKASALLHNFFSPKAGQSNKAEVELGEDSSTDTTANSAASSLAVTKLKTELAESKESAAEAAQAEAAAEKVVQRQRTELAKAEASAKKPVAPSADTKQLKTQQKQYKQAAASLKKQPGEVAAVAAKAAAAAEKVAQHQVKVAQQRDQAKMQQKTFEAENEDGQLVRGAEVQEQKAISQAQDAAGQVRKTEVQLSDAEKSVAALKAEKKAEAANAVPLAFKALQKESRTHQNLSTELQALSDEAQTEQASQERLDTNAHRIRDIAINVKNMAEQQLDRLSGKVSRLGESAASAAPGSKWEAGIKQDLSTLQKEHGQVKTLVKDARHISLEAAKIQEKEYQAADASSRLQVDAHVLARQMSVDKGDLAALKKTKPRAEALQAKLKKMAQEDHKVYVDMSHLSGEATNAEAAEASGLVQTSTELGLGSKLLHSIADDLLPGH